MSPRDQHMLTFKPSVAQWDGYLGPMGKRQRSAYVRDAVLSYIGANPSISALPLNEPADEPIRHLAIRFHGGAEAVAWLAKVPSQMRSYLIRHMLNKYQREKGPQQFFNLDESDVLQRTGTDR